MAHTGEPTELRLPRTTAGVTASRVLVDEAFATITRADLRLDDGHGRREAEDLLSPELTETLRQQLAALDSQRRELARLLGDLD